MAIPGDNPIENASEDRLGRAPLAASFARQVLALDASQGAVVGILGKWGSGKTSFVNMAEGEFQTAGSPVLNFNPWMFSGAEQLVDSFFVEVAAQLKLKPGLAEIGEDLADYGEAFAGLGWLPVVGTWIERFRSGSKALSKLIQRRREGIGGRREKLQSALKELEHPIVVVLDDIDRLSTDEIRDIFKLVRLTASFPNIVYVLAFDRGRVEKALSEQGVPGRDYLEKILQVVVDLPAIPEEVLNRQIFDALNQALAEAGDPEDVDDQVWPDVFMEVVRPLIGNMRDVRRYAGAVRGTVENIGGQVALADLLAMEAVRLFLPDVFAQLPDSVEGLCTPSERWGGMREEPPEPKQSIERLLEISGKDEKVVRALIQRLFPFAERHIGGTNYGSDWTSRFLRDRRIAHESILRLYLERVAGPQLTNHYDAKQAWEAMDDRSAFDDFLRGLDSERQEDVIAALESYEDEYTPDQVVPGAIVLSNLRPDLPERPGGMTSFGTRTVVNRVTYRLLRSLDDQEKVEAAMKQILPEVTTLSAKWELISQVGHREGAGHKLVSEDAAAAFEAAWRAEVRNASAELLARDHDLVRVLVFAKREAAEGEEDLAIPADPAVTLAVLKGARSEARSQYLGTRSVQREFRLSWDTLIDLYGDETTLLARIEELKASEIEVEADLLELIQKYIEGWRPAD
jgi:predicted KAP-like P-loop ATPase